LSTGRLGGSLGPAGDRESGGRSLSLGRTVRAFSSSARDSLPARVAQLTEGQQSGLAILALWASLRPKLARFEPTLEPVRTWVRLGTARPPQCVHCGADFAPFSLLLGGLVCPELLRLRPKRPARQSGRETDCLALLSAPERAILGPFWAHFGLFSGLRGLPVARQKSS